MSDIGNMFSASQVGMNHQYKLNQALAQEDREWQERMSNSAHQREIADLKAAGLNPVLSITGGNGATTPSGSNTNVSDGSAYFSALANLQAAQISSAAAVTAAKYNHDAAVYGANRSFDSVKYQTDHTVPSTWAGLLGKSGAYFIESMYDAYANVAPKNTHHR